MLNYLKNIFMLLISASLLKMNDQGSNLQAFIFKN